MLRYSLRIVLGSLVWYYSSNLLQFSPLLQDSKGEELSAELAEARRIRLREIEVGMTNQWFIRFIR